MKYDTKVFYSQWEADKFVREGREKGIDVKPYEYDRASETYTVKYESPYQGPYRETKKSGKSRREQNLQRAIRLGWPRLEDEELHAIAEALAHSEGDARQAHEALRIVDKLLEGYGVEAIEGEHRDVQPYSRGFVASYINMGDVYNTTILYDDVQRKFLVTTVGDFVEKFERKYHMRSGYEGNPLKHGYSEQAISDNIAREMRAGRDRSQAVAIAYQTARTAWKEKHPDKALPARLRR
jgi:hypothetical protein